MVKRKSKTKVPVTTYVETGQESEYAVENRYKVPVGQDWLSKVPKPDPVAEPGKRTFIIGTTKISEDESMADMSNEDVRNALLTQYPEIKNAKIEVGANNEVKFAVTAGRKG